MKRRHLLQMAGGTIASLGFSQIQVKNQALDYAKVLAQSTTRKRALLVGINEYTGTSKGEWQALKGAVNDVEMQRELLALRFGFKDIKTLIDADATRQNILETFNDFLIQGSKPGDVIVFHFSGHGSTVNDPDRVHGDGLSGTIVPYDHDLPVGYPNTGGAVNDITAGTLFLLMAALKQRDVHNVTVVLDSCYSGAGVRGNLIVRSRPGESELRELRGKERHSKLEMNQTEQDYQEQWLQQLHLSKEDWIKLRRGGIANGMALLAATRNQQALDAVFAQDIYAGVFTQALTRYLWQQTQAQTLNIVMNATQVKTEKFLKTVPNASLQTPYSEVEPGAGNDQKNVYFLPFENAGAADAVIKMVNGNQVKVLLTVDPTSVEALGRGAQLRLVDDQGMETGILHIESRHQLEAQGTLKVIGETSVLPGAILQEQIRAIPKDMTLNIGLDRSLESEINTAKQLLKNIPRLKVLPLLQQEVHYILGRKNGRTGLFTSGFDPYLNSMGEAGESITDAIKRLRPELSLLLAARILRLMLNGRASRLKVSVELIGGGLDKISAQAFTARGGGQPIQRIQPIQGLPIGAVAPLARLQVGQLFQLMIQNQESRDLDIGIIFLNTDGTLLPYTRQNVSAGQTISIPEKDSIEILAPLGVAEILVIASTVSLENAWRSLATESRSAVEMLAGVENLLGAISLGAGTRGSQSPPGAYQVDTSLMATLSIAFEIVEKV